MVRVRLIILVVGCIASLRSATACPEPCKCLDKFVHQIANCAYKQLETVPKGLPANITSLSLSANRLRSLSRDAFEEIPLMSSLWLSHNELVSIEKGTLAGLVQLRNLDLSNNQLADFSWEDLRNLTALQVLKLNNNNLARLPRDAFETLTDLRSLRLHHNLFATIEEGTFENLHALSHLLLYENPLRCSCKARWLPAWLNTTSIDIPSKEKIACAEPDELKGQAVQQMPDVECVAPTVRLTSSPDVRETRLYPDFAVVLDCQADGLPAPTVSWKLRKDGGEVDLGVFDEEKVPEEAAVETNDVLDKRVMAFRNGTLLIPQLSESEEGAYTCVATNDMGESSASARIRLAQRGGYERGKAKVNPLLVPGTSKKRKYASSQASITDKKGAGKDRAGGFVERNDVSAHGDSDDDYDYNEHGAPFPTPVNTACALKHAGGSPLEQALNGTPVPAFGYEQRHRFEFGVIALEVSDTDARVQLTPVPRGGDTKRALPVRQGDRGWSALKQQQQQQQQQQQANGNLGAAAKFEMMYLCTGDAPDSSPVQWSLVQSEVHFYRFHGLKPGTQYTLCLSHAGQSCEVQVPFETRKRIPSLLIMVVVSSFLLGLATIPLLGAACCHLVYQYRAKTYKPMEKPQQQQEKTGNVGGVAQAAARVVAGDQRVVHCAQRDSMCDSIGEVGDHASLQPSEEEASIAPAGCKDDAVQFDLESECSDRLPLGAEAVNIAQEINGNYKHPAR
ncbi:immunoglobulin superfamily containing leucine-rich repeat protein 2 [Lampetra fluviatilis]